MVACGSVWNFTVLDERFQSLFQIVRGGRISGFEFFYYIINSHAQPLNLWLTSGNC